jgi:uncharacterized SAM-binding protein YcdF (DUF218 family)
MKFSDYAACPLPYAVLVMVLLAVCWRRLPRGARITGVAAEVLLVLLTTPLGAGVLVAMVQSRVQHAHTCPAPVPAVIVVLSGGASRSPEAPDDYAALHLATLRRVFAGVALWRKTPGARLVMSGGGSWHIPEAVPMANLAEHMGVPASAIGIEGRSYNTWENARDVAALSPAVPKRVWLVTSALHLPRALGAFRAWGFRPCAWPSGSMNTRLHFEPGDFVPQGPAVSTATFALHELFGGVEYALLEWWHAHHVRAAQPHTP